MPKVLSALVACSALATLIHAQTDPTAAVPTEPPAESAIQTILIEAERTLLRISGENLLRGTAAFRRERHFAPEAVLKFVIVEEKQTLRPISIWLEIADDRYPVEIDSRGEFSIADNLERLSAGAVLVVNREKGSGTLRPVVRTGAIAGEDRRLGDLRLECRVLWEMTKDRQPFVTRAAFAAAGGACASSKVAFSFPTTKDVLEVHILDGSRIVKLQPLSKPRAYWPPLHDVSLSNDAIVRLRFRED